MSTSQTRPIADDDTGRRSLRANFVWTFTATSTYLVCQWGILLVLANLGTPALVGQFTLAVAITTPLTVFADRALRTLLATSAEGDGAFVDYLGFRIALGVVITVTILGFVWFYGLAGGAGVTVVLVAVLKTIEGIAHVFYGLLHRHERMELIGKSQILRGFVILVAFTGLLAMFRNLTVAVLGIAVGHTAVLVGYDRRVAARALAAAGVPGRHPFVPRFRMAAFRRILSLAMPLGVAVFLVTLSSSVPRYYLAAHYGVHELGIFSAVFHLTVPLSTLANSLGQAALPRWSKLYTSGELVSFSMLLVKSWLIVAALAVIAVAVSAALGQSILSLVYGNEYSMNSTLFLWLVVSASVGCMAAVPGIALTSTRRFYLVIAVCGVSATTSLATSHVLVPPLGKLGAAFSLLVTNLVHGSASIACLWLSRRRATLAAPGHHVSPGPSGRRELAGHDVSSRPDQEVPPTRRDDAGQRAA